MIIYDNKNKQVGKIIGTKVAGRYGRTILECGGNNSLIVMDDADVDMALKSAVFNAIGTGGQRCTTLRRLVSLYNNI